MPDTRTVPAPETAAVNDADRHAEKAEELAYQPTYATAAQVHATLALAAELRAARLQLADELAQLRNVLEARDDL